ncbi:hypothetical protein ISX56_29195 [Serratia ureilytica]|nr:hypothetical protein [Serratia ureilytica]
MLAPISNTNNATTIAGRLRVVAHDILYHQHSKRFSMTHELAALEKMAAQHPDNPVGQFCYYHFSRIARHRPPGASVISPDSLQTTCGSAASGRICCAQCRAPRAMSGLPR